MNFIGILLLVSFVLSCLCIMTNRIKGGKTKLPPGPIPLPIIGNLLKLGNKPHESLSKLSEIYGPLMLLKLGSLTTIVVSSSDVAKEVLQKNDQTFANRTVVDAARVYRFPEFSMVWLPACSRWRTLRKICNSQIFNTQRLNANQDVRRQKVEELLSHIQSCCPSATEVDIGLATFVTTLNLLSNTVFSVDLVSLDSKSGQEFKAIVWGLLEAGGKPNLSDYFPLIRPLDLQGIRRSNRILFGKLYSVFGQMIDQRLRSRESGKLPACNDFLDTLLDHSEENGFEVGFLDIKALLTDIFVAGTDTTTSTLEWAMAEVLRNPNILAKARLEINEAMGKDKTIEESDIVKFPYLQAIVKETLRLHPPAPFLIPHSAETNVEICGFTVPKDAQVLVNAWAIGRDPKTWVKPTTFMPERFLESDIDFRGRDFELIPFGAGRRICPGLPLAYRMVHLMLASLLHSFDWKLENELQPQDLDMEEKFGLTLQKDKPLRLIPVSM